MIFSAVPIARILGFEIRVHVSWAVILAIIAVTVEAQVASLAPEVTSPVRWAIGAVVATAFLLSALAHELGHAVAARRAGMPGGPVVRATSSAEPPRPTLEASRPRDEMAAALAGPVVSIAVGVTLLLVALVGELAGGVASAVGRIALVVGVMNVVLGLVNLLPAFPLDGGRVARAVAWERTGDPNRGLRIAASSGRYLGILLATIGVVSILAIDSMDGLMLALGGWFLVSGARAVERTADVEKMLEGIRVGDVMDHDVSGVPPGLTLDTFADQILRSGSSDSVPVMRGLDLLGMIGARAGPPGPPRSMAPDAGRGPHGQRRLVAVRRSRDEPAGGPGAPPAERSRRPARDGGGRADRHRDATGRRGDGARPAAGTQRDVAVSALR